MATKKTAITLKSVQKLLIVGVVVFIIVLLLNAIELLGLTNLSNINKDPKIFGIYFIIAVIFALANGYIIAYLVEFLYRYGDGVFSEEEGIATRFISFAIFFTILCGMMILNLFGEKYFFTGAILATALFFIVVMISYVAPKVLSNGAHSGAKEGTLASKDAKTSPSEPTEEEIEKSQEKSSIPFWFWIFVIIAAMIFLGALSRAFKAPDNQGGQKQSKSNQSQQSQQQTPQDDNVQNIAQGGGNQQTVSSGQPVLTQSGEIDWSKAKIKPGFLEQGSTVEQVYQGTNQQGTWNIADQ